MRKKKSHRAIYGLLGTVVAVTAIGNVAAKETKPYKAPELRLVKGTEEYDLTEGITYDKGKYELMVEDTGDFDIEVLGKYTVEYSLTPLDEEDGRYSGTDNASKNEDPELDSAFQVGPGADKEETSSDSQAGSTKAASGESAASDGSAAKAESTEASHYNKEDKKEASAAADLKAGKIGIAKTEKKGGFFTRLFARLSGFVHAAELDETKAYVLETEAQDSEKDKAETGKADTDKAGKAEAKESETSAAETKESEAGEAETVEPETGAAESSKAETMEPETSAAETKESATATSSNADGTLDEDDGIIYFDRIVRVVASDTGSNIEFDDPRLEIPASAELFGIQIHGEFPVATDSNATPAEEDAKATNSNASKPTSDKEAADTLDEGFWVNENETDTENEAFSGDSDGATESGIEYTLVLKKPELLLEDAYFTDPDGKKQKKVEIKVKNAEELKDAVLVEENEKGVPVITGMELGTYTIELSAVDPDIEEEITCEREVEVVPGQRVKFDAPTLYIGTRNTSYDLTSGMVARDENGTEVTELYVVDETELLAAKEEVATASNANAETAAGQEEGEETQKEGAAGTGLKKGIYHAVIGAKHPVTGEEFTVSRKVEVIDGYYIYAPVLEIRAGSTDYDLTSGAEVRDASGTEEKTVDGVAITIEDVSDLYRGVETGEDAGEDEAEEETTAGEENTADGIAAEQTDAAASYSFSAYALSLASEDTAGSETGTETGTEAADSAEAAAETETTGEFKTEKPALQEGTYMVTLSAVDPNTGEKIYMTRQVRVAARSATLFQYQALNTSVKGNTSSVSELPGKVTSWVDFLPTTGRGEILRNGGKADVTLTATENTNVADLLFTGFETAQGLDSNASISIDGNNNVFAKDKLKQPATYSDGGRKFDITIPAMQVEMKNFVFDGLTGYPAYGTAAAIENQSSKIRMSEGSYLRLDNNKLELSSDFATWPEANRAKYNGSRYGESGVDNADFYNRVSTTHMMILPVAGAEQKYDLSVVQGSTYSPRYLIKSPRNIVVDAANGVTSSPLAARNIGGNATVKLGNNGIAELYYLKGAQKTTVEGTGTIKFRTYYDALDRTTDYQDGISTQVLEVQDNVTFAKGVFGGRETGQPIIRITGDNGKIKLPNGKKITVARVANPTTPSEHDGGLTKVLKNDVIATAEKTGVLNPLDFIIWGQTLPAIDSKDKYLYLELDSTGKKLTAVERDPVWKISISGESHTAYTFEQALDYLKNKTGGCVLTNSTDYTMTEEDIRALEQFSNTNVSINLEAGFKTEKTYDNTYNVGIVHGDYSYRLYVSSFPNQELNLPKNVDVLFEDVVFQFITKQNGPITIVGNGGTTTFRGETNYFYDLDNTRMKPILYGGTKDGKGTGLKESILCFQPIVFSVYYGMGNSELTYKDARQYDAEFTSIYNFDELKFIEGPVGGNGLAGKGDDYGGTVSVERELNAQKDGILTKDGGYKGRITLATYYAQLVLKGRDAIHRAGSLQGNVKNTSNSGQIEIQGGAAEYPDGAGGLVTRSNVKNQYILTLTDEDPLCYKENINLPDMGLRIKRHENAANGEIAVYLPNVPDEKAQKYITTKWMYNNAWEFKAPFCSIKEDANGHIIKDYTIRWIGSGIYHYINVKTGWETNFVTLEELLETMKRDEKTSPNGEYIISAYAVIDWGDQRFIMSSEDAEALKKAVTTITTPKKITWTSAYDVNGDRIERNRSALTLKTDFHFFGQESVVKEMHLRFDGNWNMYANGKPLTFDKELDIESYNANRANIFGGNKDGQGITNTHLTFNTDTEIFANIYGGSASGTCAADAVIDFKDGYGYAVYGGNKEGSHTGKTSITIARKPNAEYNEILLVNGGSEKEPNQKKPEGKTVDIITRGNLKVKNLYNYDSLTVETGSLTIPNSDKAGEYNINAAFTEGYAGKTVLCDETTMQLLNYKGTRKMGSLTRAAQADLTDEAKQPKLVMKKADKDDAGHTASSKENKYLLELTAKDPFDMANFETNRKIKVSYDDAKSEAVGDVLFYLSDAAKAEQAADKPGIASLFRSLFRAKAANTGKTYYVTTKAINWQHNIVPIANESEKTIALPEPRVLLLDKSETVLGSYPDVAGAIVDIAAKEKQNSKAGDTYTIAVFTTDYTFTEADRLAAAYAAGKYTGDFDYNEKGHDLSTISNANITWSGQYITEKATKTGNTNLFRVVNHNGNFDFFGATTLVNNIKFNYDKNAATDRDLYANGSTLTFGTGFSFATGSAYPNLYGGDGTNKTAVVADADDTVSAKKINVLFNATFHDIKDFTELSIGNGQAAKILLTVTGTLDSDPSNTDNSRVGNVSLNNAELKFTGTEQGHIGNLKANSNAANTINIYKGVDGTKPLLVDGEIQLDAATPKPVLVNVNTTAVTGREIVVSFSKKNADKTKTKSAVGNYVIDDADEKANLILLGNTYVWKYHAASGASGNFRTFGGLAADSIAATVGGSSNPKTLGDWSRFETTKKQRGFYEIDENGDPVWLDEPDIVVEPTEGVRKNSEYTMNPGIAYADAHTYNSFLYFLSDWQGMTPNMNKWSRSSSMEISFGNDGTSLNMGKRFDKPYMYKLISTSNETVQLSFKSFALGDDYPWRSNQTEFKGFSIANAQVMRLDSIYGNGYGWERSGYNQGIVYLPNAIGVYGDWNREIGNTSDYPDAVLQIRLSDKFSTNPAYQIGWGIGTIMVQSSSTIPDNEISVVNFTKIAQIDLKKGNTLKFAGLYGNGGYNTKVQFLGTGKVYMTNLTIEGSGAISEAQDIIKTNQIVLRDGDITVGKGRTGLGSEIINVTDDLLTNGHRIKGIRLSGSRTKYRDATINELDLRENDVFAVSPANLSLDATDFTLEKPKEGTDGLYFTAESKAPGGSQIVVRKFYQEDGRTVLDKPIKLSDGTNTTYYSSYKDAFCAIAQTTGSPKDYTITNLVEREFDPYDASGMLSDETQNALLSITKNQADSLTFESAVRTAEYGKSAGSYEVRLRHQTMTLPEDVNVTFKNMVFKYDQGLKNRKIDNGGTEVPYGNVVIIGNGGELNFENVVFLSHNDANMYPIVYGGSENGKATQSLLAKLFARAAAKPAVINVSGKYKFASVYNYDELNLKESANGTSLTVINTLNAQKENKTETEAYRGETKIANGAVLVLPNADGTKKIGSLKGLSTVTAGETGKLQVARPKLNKGEAIPVDNPAVLVLTGENPLESSDDTNKITVSYTDAVDDFGKPINNDVVMSLPNVPDTEAAARVTTQYLVDGFGGEDLYNNKIAMRAKPDNKTIVLQSASVGLTIGADPAVKTYTTLKDALDAITANETSSADKGVAYRITFLVNGYVLDEKDINAMKAMAGTTAGQITWTSKIGADGQEIAVNNVVTVPDALNFFGTATVLENITMNYNGQQDIYANGIPMEIKSNVYMTGAAKPTLYGGSSTEAVSTTSLTINGGSFAAVYGGGKGFGADETSVVITAAQDGASVYGGSMNAVTGKTSVSITVPNTANADAFSFADVSGFGTDDTSALAANVTGDAAVTIKQAQPNEYCTTTITNLSGFTTLDLGDTAGAFDKQHFDITGRFDSKVTDEADGRTDTVNLNAATLITSGGSGHIGSLVSAGGSCLTVKKDGDTFPLLVDGTVTKNDDNRIKLKVKDMSTQLGDIMVTYTVGANADKTLYIDGGDYNLSVVTADNGADATKTDILFANPYAHTVEGEVEYDTTGNVDEAGNLVSKFMTFKYDGTNPDHVLRGYVIPMPEEKVNAADSKKYTDMNTSYVINGTYDGGAAYPIYEIEWTRSDIDNSAKGRTKTVVPIQANTWYIAHIVCEENKHTYSFLVDVTAPRQVTDKDVAVSYDGTTKTYTVSASFMDPTVEHMTQHPLPDAQTGVNAKLSYKSHGLVQYAWALGDTTGNAAADQAAKDKVMQTGAAKAGIREVKDEKVIDSNAGTYTFKVEKADLKTGQDVVWIYVKDGVNNTVRLAVPMTDHMIDVTVPTRVSVVALKKSAASANAAVPELLTPICYIRNNGDNKIKAEVSGFVMKDVAENEKDTSGLTLVDKEKGAVDFNTTELALFVKKDTLLTNVKKLAAQSDPVTGHGPMTLGEITKDSLLDFTFDAGYDPVNIVETTNWLTNEMSYHFLVVK